jgi:hypothetical protein
MADYQYLTDNGVIVPDTSDILTETQTEFKNALGDDLDVSSETPQGTLIAAETLAREEVVRNNAAVANQINPNLAGGIFLDAIWALTGGQRFVALPTIVRDVVLTGIPGVIVTSGAIATVGAAGDQFQLLSNVTIGSDGTGLGTFQSVELGPIAAPALGLNSIASSVLGWETVSNPAAGTTGQPEESDIASRTRRRRTLALQGVALPEAITSSVYSAEGIRSMTFRENVTNASIVIEGKTLVAHSIYACVDGGTDLIVATALLQKKSLGANWNGTTVVNVTEPITGQIYPVQFDRPTEVPIFVQVTVRGGAAYPDVPGIVRSSMIDYANGLQEGEDGFIVGGDVSPFELAGAVNREAPTIFVQNLLLSLNNVTFSAATIPITISQLATLLEGNIAVTVTP